ncbi:N-6 DNA methylase [Thiocystis violacea]|uniref:N-6 DNA methylase n=1 Tax=Thiocystis violacea TaxID=13725 RepID=UPI00190619FB|nr:N-6 DNA methylase [Thiocystis violacea]MBK1720111.1 hypothetical protein [Thiocystis violacea]
MSKSNVDQPARVLSRAIETLAARGRHDRPDEWLRCLCQDVLAGFGRRLAQPWDEARHEALHALSALYGKLVGDHPWTDILGSVYMEFGSRGQHRWLGQYFTPQTVATCMAEMQLTGLEDRLSENELIRVLEPTSGSGVMLLAMCECLQRRHGVAALRRFAFTAIDLDRLCAEMTATQLLANAAFHGEPGELHVYHGNALTHATLEIVVSFARSPAFIDRLDDPTIPPDPRPTCPTPSPAMAFAVAVGEQMSLF